MTLDANVKNPERLYFGNIYELHVVYGYSEEQLVMVYEKGGSVPRMMVDQPPGLCWTFPRSLDSFLQDPATIDILAEDIIDYLNSKLIYAMEEEPLDCDEDGEPLPPTIYDQLSLFPSSMLSEKPYEEDIPYTVDHSWNTYQQRRYCFFD